MKLPRATLDILANKAGFIIDEDSKKFQPNYIASPSNLLDEYLDRFATLVMEEYSKQSRARGIR